MAEPLERMVVEYGFPGLFLSGMVAMAYPDDDTNRLFVALQPGRIVVFAGERTAPSTDLFLDITDKVSDQGREEGLLGLAFDPRYRDNAYFYVYYSAAGPRRSVVSRFSADGNDPSVADPDSERIILEVEQPYANHNGGQLVFGPEGYLYVGLGDGGSRADPHGNGQDPSTLLGSILRIDVSAIDSEGAYSIPPDNPFVGLAHQGRGEIWAYGLRNPWRFTFDRLTGDLWAADVGQNLFEEVDIMEAGRNYGWSIMEGFSCFQSSEEACDTSGLTMPIVDYGHEDGCSVTGGYVYRGSRLPSLYGAYVYGDFCSGKIWALRYDGSRVTEHMQIADSRLQIASFGEDQSGELYILAFDEKIYRLAPGPN